MLDTERSGGYHASPQMDFFAGDQVDMAKSQKTVADVKVANQLAHIEQQLQKILDGYDCKDAGWYASVDEACDDVHLAAHEARIAAGVPADDLEGGDLESTPVMLLGPEDAAAFADAMSDEPEDT